MADDERPDYKVYRSRPRCSRRAADAIAAAARDELRRAPGAARDPAAAAGPPRPGEPRRGRRGGRRRRGSPPAASLTLARRSRSSPGSRSRWCSSWSPPRSSRRGLRRRRARARRRAVPAHGAEHDPRARLRRAHQGLGGAGRADRRPEPLGLDHAACASAAARTPRSRSRATRSSTSPATGATRSTPPTRSAARARRSDRQAVPRHRRQPRRRGQLRELPAADRRARRRHLQRRLRASRSINGGDKQRRHTLRLQARGARARTASRRSRSPARARTSARPSENDLDRAPAASSRSSPRSRTRSPRSRRSCGCRGCRGRRRRRSAPTWRGPTLLGLVGGRTLHRRQRQASSVLKPSGGVTLPDGGAGLIVSDAGEAARRGALPRAAEKPAPGDRYSDSAATLLAVPGARRRTSARSPGRA